MNHTQSPNIAFIGFGEAGAAFANGFRSELPDLRITVFDIKTLSHVDQIRQGKLVDYYQARIQGAETMRQALSDARLVFSLVTADQALLAASAAADDISHGAFFFDCNSCAPGTKRQSATLITQAGARYVDMAVMAPVHPLRHKTPVLLAGEHAQAALPLLQALGMDAKVVPGAVGAAAAVKMTRSIFVKGLEALLAECVLTGRQSGVDALVLDSLDASFPGMDWRKQAAYALDRTLTHGVRRAAEMREVAVTVGEAGLAPDMSTATVAWQQRLGDLHLNAREIGLADYATLADAVLAALTRPAT